MTNSRVGVPNSVICTGGQKSWDTKILNDRDYQSEQNVVHSYRVGITTYFYIKNESLITNLFHLVITLFAISFEHLSDPFRHAVYCFTDQI